jgi:hypothetical protein
MYSIITTFGCGKNCYYCISKQIGLETNPDFYKDPIWRARVSNTIHSNFSISGGGDPFYEFEKHLDFWHAMDYLAESNNCWYDVHTMISDLNIISHLKRLRKLVLHITPSMLTEKLYADRVVMVMDDTITIGSMRLLESMYKDCQIAYRELVDPSPDINFKPNWKVDLYAKTIRLRNRNGRYIKQKDYNVYIWPNGEIRKKFLPDSVSIN